MTPTVGNYATHAQQDLLLQAAHCRTFDPHAARVVDWVREQLHLAQKFQLPPAGLFFDDPLRTAVDHLRLPFPVIAVEFPPTDGERPEVPAGMEDPVYLPRRLALACEITKESAGEMAWFLGEKDLHRTYELGTSILIISIPQFEDTGMFSVIPAASLVRPDPIGYERKADEHLEPIEVELTKKGDGHPCNSMPGTMTHIFDLFGESELAVEFGRDERNKGFLATNCDRMAVLGLIEALSCSNVSMMESEAPVKLNRARVKKGKAPFYTYRTLVVEVPATRKTSTETGTGRSPRQHLRRGHIRRLPPRKLWINATVVGNADIGMHTKGYRVLAAQ